MTVLETVGGALLGLLLTELLAEVRRVRDGVRSFEPKLTQIEGTLETLLRPTVEELDRLNKDEPSDRSKIVADELRKIMEKGKSLVSECHALSDGKRSRSIINKFFTKKKGNCFKKADYYWTGLVELDNELLNFNNKFLQLNIYLDVRTLRSKQRQGFIQLQTLVSLVLVVLSAMPVIMYKAMTAIMSESGIKDVDLLRSTIEQLEDTMRSLVRVLEEIEANGKEVVMMNDEEEADRSKAARSLRSLLDEGEKLVFESSNIGWGNFNKKWEYRKNMVELENKLLRFHRFYLLRAGLAKISYKTRDDCDLEMKDKESPVPYYVKDRHEKKGTPMYTREQEPNNMLNYRVTFHGMSHCIAPPNSIPIGGLQQQALGHCLK